MKHNFDNFKDKPTDTNRKSKNNKKNKLAKNKPVKKSNTKTLVIIAVCVVAILTGVIVLFASTPDITGTWLHKTDDGNEYYYTLYKEDGECKVDISQGTVHYTGTYEVSTQNAEKKITFDIKYGNPYPQCLNNTYVYNLKKNKLTLVTDDKSTITLSRTKTPESSDYLKPFDDFKTDKKLLGTWVMEYENIGTMTLSFNDDGTMLIDSFGAGYQQYVYTVSDGKIKLSYYDTILKNQEEPYSVENNQLQFLGINWTKK